MKNPVLFTIVYGLACSLALYPMVRAGGIFVGDFVAFCAACWVFLAGYCLYLTSRAKASYTALLFPLALLLVPLAWGRSVSMFLLLGVGVLSWVRTGLGCGSPGLRGLFAELVLGVGGAALVAGLGPRSLAGWAAGVWVFFLVQSLFFLLFEEKRQGEPNPFADPFEEARKKARAILSRDMV